MADIIPLSGAPRLTNAAKTEFMNHLSGAFDGYVQKTGSEPSGIVLILGGLGQGTSVCWHMRAASDDHASEVLAKAVVHLMKEAQA
jgi:hypothetical protein